MEKYLEYQVKEGVYDSATNFTLLKLYQLNPEKYVLIPTSCSFVIRNSKIMKPHFRYSSRMMAYVLLKCIMALPQTDLSVAKCLIDPAKIAADGAMFVSCVGLKD